MRRPRALGARLTSIAIVVTVAAGASACSGGGVDDGYAYACPGPLGYDSTAYDLVEDAVPVTTGRALGTATLPPCVAANGTPAADARQETVHAVSGFPSSKVVAVVDGGTVHVWVADLLSAEQRCELGIIVCTPGTTSS